MYHYDPNVGVTSGGSRMVPTGGHTTDLLYRPAPATVPAPQILTDSIAALIAAIPPGGHLSISVSRPAELAPQPRAY